MGGCRLLYFVKSKNGTKCKNFAVLLCFYVNTFILLYFLRWQKGGATAPLATPLNPPLVSVFNVCVCFEVASTFTGLWPFVPTLLYDIDID